MSGRKIRSPGKLAARGFPKICDWENLRLGRASREIGNSINAKMPRGNPRGIFALILEQIVSLFTRFRGTGIRDSFESASVSRK